MSSSDSSSNSSGGMGTPRQVVVKFREAPVLLDAMSFIFTAGGWFAFCWFFMPRTDAFYGAAGGGLVALLITLYWSWGRNADRVVWSAWFLYMLAYAGFAVSMIFTNENFESYGKYDDMKWRSSQEVVTKHLADIRAEGSDMVLRQVLLLVDIIAFDFFRLLATYLALRQGDIAKSARGVYWSVRFLLLLCVFEPLLEMVLTSTYFNWANDGLLNGGDLVFEMYQWGNWGQQLAFYGTQVGVLYVFVRDFISRTCCCGTGSRNRDEDVFLSGSELV